MAAPGPGGAAEGQDLGGGMETPGEVSQGNSWFHGIFMGFSWDLSTEMVSYGGVPRWFMNVYEGTKIHLEMDENG